jgi:hypothetical protein
MGIPELPSGPQGELSWSGRVHAWRIRSLDEDTWIVHRDEDPRYEGVLHRTISLPSGPEFDYTVMRGRGAGETAHTTLPGLFASTLL